MKLKTLSIILLLCSPLISCEDNGGGDPDYHTSIEYPYFLVDTDEGKSVIVEKGEDPLISFFVSRKPSDRLFSVAWLVNGSEVPSEQSKKELGETWDRNDIVHSVIDKFEMNISTEGNVNVMIVAEYVSGTIYKPTIKYKHDGKY